MDNKEQQDKQPDTVEAKAETATDVVVETAVVQTEASAASTASDESKNTSAPRSSNNRQSGRGRTGGDTGGSSGGDSRKGGRSRKRRSDKPQDEFESTIVDLARVTRVMAGGKRMSFRACVVVGDKKGRVAMGIKKGADVQLAVQKATDQAKKHLVTVPLVGGTIPHTTEKTFKGAQVMLKPAKAGTGVIAGGAVRIVMDLAGVTNVVAKMKGSTNKVNNVQAVLAALRDLRTKEEIEQLKTNS